MIQCPWCSENVVLVNNVCPECKHEVLPEHLDTDGGVSSSDSISELVNLNLFELIENNYRCSKCNCDECIVKEVSMSGTGLSKIFDIEYNHYLFVSCSNCGIVNIYNPDVLRGHKSGKVGTIIDILFG